LGVVKGKGGVERGTESLGHHFGTEGLTGLQFAAEHVDIGQGLQRTAHRLSQIQGPCLAKTIVRLLFADELARRRDEQREGFGVTFGRNHHQRDVRADQSVRWQR
jgi:hypothetical protein